MTLDDALAAMGENPAKAGEMAAYHKASRRYLGVSNPQIDALTKEWRAGLTLQERCALAESLWDTDIHEARVAAAKLFTQARIKPDDTQVWEIIVSWVPQFDAWAIADHACMAGQKRLLSDPSRIETVAEWTTSDHLWTKRAAMVMTLPWTKQNHPKPDEVAVRERVLEWAAGYCDDRAWFIQKSVAWWIRELSKHDPDRARAFLEAHGEKLRPSLRKEAGRKLPA